jgi:hypothetical protein
MAKDTKQKALTEPQPSSAKAMPWWSIEKPLGDIQPITLEKLDQLPHEAIEALTEGFAWTFTQTDRNAIQLFLATRDVDAARGRRIREHIRRRYD